MKVLVGCEFSGIVRKAFSDKGHNATSCDFLDTEIPGDHYKGNILDLLNEKWDLAIIHPPCQYLAVSGSRWFKFRKKEQKLALDFVKIFFDIPIKKVCIENPVSIISTVIRKPDQIINPYQFGHTEKKRTCLWLKNLPKLKPTKIMKERKQTLYYLSPSKERSKIRSRTFKGIARAMANQWT